MEDLAKLIASLRAPYREGVEQGIYGMGFFQGLDPRQLRAQVEELIVEPYLDVLGQFAAQYSGDSDRLAHVEVLLAGIVQAFSDETGTGLLPALDQP